MIPYICLNLALASLWFLCMGKKSSRVICNGKSRLFTEKEVFECISIITIAFFMGMRGPFTADYINYCALFDETVSRTILDIIVNKQYVETGYLVFAKVIGAVVKDANIFMFIQSFCCIFMIAWVAKKYKQVDFLLFVMLFVNAGVYFHAFNLIRQAFAAAIVFIAIYMLSKGNVVAYLIVVALAATVHTSALIMVPVLPLLLQKIDMKNILRTTVLGLITIALLPKIVEFVQRYRYANYSYGMGNGTANAFVLQWSLCLFVFFAIRKKWIDIKDRKNVVLINAMWMYLIFSVATLSVFQMSRICYFFSTPLLVLVGKSIEKIQGKSGVVIKIGVIVILILYSYIWLSGTGYDPYYTFLQ